MPEKGAENPFMLLVAGQKEPISSFLDMRLEELKPGYARVKMKLRPEYLNFHGIVFGGIIMSLADQAFSYAVNSMAYPNIASEFNVYFLASAHAGDELTAEGKIIKSGRRVSLAEVNVINQDGKLIAKATGTTIAVEPG